MIIDRIQLTGIEAYFRNRDGKLNLAGETSRTARLEPRQQTEIFAIELLIESDDDLTDLFNAALDDVSSPPTLKRLFSITVMKEMFPSLFADPFRHRVYNIAGFEDFKRGTLENGKVLDVDGIPTIVSVGTETCRWTSPLYTLPKAVRLSQASWELAASRKTPRGNFKYSLKLDAHDADRNLQTISLADNFTPKEKRKRENIELKEAVSYQITFEADVEKDSAFSEKHINIGGESIGTPLLRAVNLLEPVESIYDICSLQELLSLSSEYHLFEFQGQPLKKMLVTLDLSATLVQGDVIDTADGKFEFIQIAVETDKFSNLEAKLNAAVLIKPHIG